MLCLAAILMAMQLHSIGCVVSQAHVFAMITRRAVVDPSHPEQVC